MVDFAHTLAGNKLRELLLVALDGKGAFRRFKDVLLSYPAEREKWFSFEEERINERAEEWLKEIGVTVDTE